MFYGLSRRLLFLLSPETAHHLSLDTLAAIHRMGLAQLLAAPVPASEREVMGLHFPNPVGLAAGLDKNGDYIDALGALGFGFLEVGTVTPRPQPGNPAPRLFRLPAARAIINRMGFNNKGVDHLVKQVRNSQYQGVIGINIGKNFDTSLDLAADDYLIGLNKVYAHAGYVAVNISSPNTPGLRNLQQGDALDDLLSQLKAAQTRLADTHGRYVPLAVKIAPDLDEGEVQSIADVVRRHRMDGVIATNTTSSRTAVEDLPHGKEQGGLSGAPLKEAANRVVTRLHRALGDELPIIGVGGIGSGADALERVRAGASLVQIYTGFIYRGPALVREIALALQ